MEKSMANMHQIDYNAVLSDLKIKRVEVQNEFQKKIVEIDNTILHVENLTRMGILQNNLLTTPIIKPKVISTSDISQMTLYDATIYLLEKKGATLKTDDIANEYIASGKKFTSSNPRLSIGPSLYKIAKEKKGCRLVKVGESEWGLTDWYIKVA